MSPAIITLKIEIRRMVRNGFYGDERQAPSQRSKIGEAIRNRETEEERRAGKYRVDICESVKPL